ncbi:acyl-CoA dehydrogenase [Nocardioides sp. AE5]|uniref:acyl-CoA dehydrogenase n=1 Tax=Nocardioides sp. AE5 TaxID=2962573 RepID=UPI002881A2F7|nr:acyl-CoA dehydrogenase [Nocardioides sp. AE5]MDT0203141.1 acyl-CoA dehydrogenase [Nocardioides sp. AE5]
MGENGLAAGLVASGIGAIGLGEDLVDLRDSVRGLFRRHLGDDTIRVAADAKTEELPEWWPHLAAQGLLGLHLPEPDGGAGFGLGELAVAVEESGRWLAPGPFVPTVLASAVLDAAGHRHHIAGLADGTTIGAVDLSGAAPGLVGERGADGSLRISGTSGAIPGGQLAGIFVLPVAVDGATRWVVVDRDEGEVIARDSYDVLRRLATLTVEGLEVPRDDVLDIDPQRPLDLAAILLGAEGAGIADWATATAAEYAATREQFGRPIGQFQGVKHRVARMLVRTEQARACAWDAARALDEPGGDRDESSLAVAIAGATSVPAAFEVANALIQVLGGIGHTWEHLAGFALRRTQSSLILLGGTAAWECRVAGISLAGVRRPLGLELPAEAEQVRADVAAELDQVGALEEGERVTRLADLGYTAPHFPQPWGKGADAVAQVVIAEELAARDLSPHDMIIGNWAVPTLLAHGDAALQERLVPPSLRGELEWCQMFSEPGAGSDLAALTTRADKVDGGWRINGQKVWTSGATHSDYAILLARTDREVAKHKGISYFVLDMTTPGIDIRPLRQITGEAHFNEVFLDDVFVPDDMLVGEPGDGWRLAITTLGNERVHMTSNSATGTAELLFAHVDRADAVQMATLGRVLADAQSGGLLGLRQTIRSVNGLRPGAEASLAKLVSAENIQATWQALMEFQGEAALMVDPAERSATWWFLSSRALTIAGGTTDVQLNIIGERLLGLPRDPAPQVRR